MASPSAGRRQREKQQLRTKILAAARQLFVERGYDAVSMRQIAQKIEYTPTAIYFHFKDKQDLINQCCAEEFLNLAKAFQHLMDIKDPVVRLKKMGMQYIEFGLTNPNHYRLLFMTPHPHQAPEKNKIIRRGDASEDAYEILRSTILQCIAQGRFSKRYQDPELASQVVWSCVHGFTSLYMARAHDPWIPWRPFEEIANAVLDLTIVGLTGELAPQFALAAPAKSLQKKSLVKKGTGKRRG